MGLALTEGAPNDGGYIEVLCVDCRNVIGAVRMDYLLDFIRRVDGATYCASCSQARAEKPFLEYYQEWLRTRGAGRLN